MIGWLWRWIKRAGLVLVLLVLALLAPVAWNHFRCVGPVAAADYTPILPPEHHRDEGRTLMTFMEWHIVHAYDDYARVISEGDPHEFGYMRAIGGYWTTLCALSKAAGDHGGATGVIMQTAYTIGVSFTAELLGKAAYEETLGRLFATLRGPDRAPLDDLSAQQAKAYATFLQQVPWYEWDFPADRAALKTAATDTLRDRERALALGLEFGAKAGYAEVIKKAVEAVGDDTLTLRMIVSGLDAETLGAFDGVRVIDERLQGIEIETIRYRALTQVMAEMAANGAEFVEIAGNDDILFTALSPVSFDRALHSFPRQGYGDIRHLVLVKVSDLAAQIRGLGDQGLTLEHIHDY